MANEVDELLTAEEAVQDVLKELHALKEEVGGYESAKQSLEAVRQSLDALVERTSNLADSATTMLGKIGTPEIIARVEHIKQAVTESAIDSANQMLEIIARSERIKLSIVESAAESTKQMRENMTRSESIKLAITKFAEKSEKQMPEIIVRTESIKQTITESAAESGKQVKSMKSTATAGLRISIVSLLLSAAILAKLFFR